MTALPKLLNSQMEEERRIRPIDVSISNKIVPLSYASMQLAENDNIPARSYIELFTPNGSAGVFRTKKRPDVYGNSNPTVELEHAITDLGDYIVRENIEEKMTLAEAMAQLFYYYDGGNWQLGTITATDNVLVDVAFEPVLQAILGVLEQVPDYYLSFDFETYPWTVSLAQRGTSVSAEGRLSRNVESAVVTTDDSDVCTRVFVKGLPAQEDQDEGDIGYLDADTVSTYGVIEYALDTTSDLTAEQATLKATTYLSRHKNPKYGVSVNGIDFSSITGESLDRIDIAKKYRLALPDYNTSVEEVITGINWQSVYLNPMAVTIELAEETDPMIDYFAEQAAKSRSSRRAANRAIDGLHYELYSEDGYLRSWLDFTESYFRTAFEDTTNGWFSEIEATASYWRSTYQTADGLLGQITQTAESWRSVYQDAYSNLGEITQTANYWRAEYTTASSLRATFEISAASIQAVLSNANSEYSSITQTAQSITAVLSNANSEYSTITQTATSISAVLSNANSEYSSITQTAQSITAVLSNANSEFAEIQATANSWRTAYTDVINCAKSEVVQTAQSWKVTIENTGNSERASILATASSLSFSANQIYLNGTTRISDLFVYDATTEDLSVTNLSVLGKLTAVDDLATFGNIKVLTGSTIQMGTNSVRNMSNMIVSAAVSGDRLILTPLVGNDITFRKAASKVSGAWSGRTYVVSANENGTDLPKSTQIYDGLVPSGSASSSVRNGHYYVEQTYKVFSDDGEGDADVELLSKTVSLSADSIYVAGRAYEAGTISVAVPYCTANAVGASAQRTTVYLKASATSSYTGSYAESNSATLTLGRATFSQSGTAYRCVNLYQGNTIIGRISVQDDYIAGRNSTTVSNWDTLVEGSVDDPDVYYVSASVYVNGQQYFSPSEQIVLSSGGGSSSSHSDVTPFDWDYVDLQITGAGSSLRAVVTYDLASGSMSESIPLYMNYQITQNTLESAVTPPSGYYGFGSVVVNVAESSSADVVNNWSLSAVSGTSYKVTASVYVNGTQYTSGQLDASTAYSNGYTNGFNDTHTIWIGNQLNLQPSSPLELSSGQVICLRAAMNKTSGTQYGSWLQIKAPTTSSGGGQTVVYEAVYMRDHANLVLYDEDFETLPSWAESANEAYVVSPGSRIAITVVDEDSNEFGNAANRITIVGGGSSNTEQHTSQWGLYCSEVVNNTNGTKTVRFSTTISATQNNPFTAGNTYQFWR